MRKEKDLGEQTRTLKAQREWGENKERAEGLMRATEDEERGKTRGKIEKTVKRGRKEKT